MVMLYKSHSNEYFYCISRNSDDLDAYFYLRELNYKLAYEYTVLKDSYDTLGNILITKKNGKVIGGCRITIKEINSAEMLPLEYTYGFKLNAILPELSQTKYCEL